MEVYLQEILKLVRAVKEPQKIDDIRGQKQLYKERIEDRGAIVNQMISRKCTNVPLRLHCIYQPTKINIFSSKRYKTEENQVPINAPWFCERR